MNNRIRKMMKRIFFIAMICCLGQLQLASAQSAEFQQLVLNIEKLTQLRQILADMKKGYQIADQGFGRIKDISQGNFQLHKAFLDGLLAVNPELRKYRRVSDIFTCQLQLLKEYKTAYNRFLGSGQFKLSEIEYMGKVYGNLFNKSLENLDELSMIFTAGKLRMSDDERLEGVNRIYFEMQEKLTFLRSFNRRTESGQQRRIATKKELEILRKLQPGK